jgi:succinoglycan biosynthesis protein ExoM
MGTREAEQTGCQRGDAPNGTFVLEDPKSQTVDVSIVVPTMRRQALLPALVQRLFEQAGCESVALEVVIVDNCPDESASAIVTELCRRYGARLRYVGERRPGVSHVRNSGIIAARGSLIGFIDDDEIPGETWLANMLACRTRYAADVVLGPVYPDFELPEAAQDPLFRGVFTQASDRPTGAMVEPKSPLRVLLHPASCYRTMATNNALVDRELFRGTTMPFNPALTHLGGEDALFFHGLYLAGNKIVWCREAAVFERIPAERSELRYLLTRRFRDGQITSVTCLLTRPKQYGRLLTSMAVGVLQLLLGGLFALCTVLTGDRRAREAISAVAAGAGKLLWMQRFHHRSYGMEAGAATP